MTTLTKLDPATQFVRSLPGTYYMVREAAEMIGIHHRTLRKFNDSNDPEHVDLKPSYLAYLGKVKIYLYTEDDVDKIKEYLKDRMKVIPNDPTAPRQVGRPGKFNKEDRKERQKLFSKAHYYGKRAQEELDKGDMQASADYLAKQRQVKDELKNWPQIESPSV